MISFCVISDGEIGPTFHLIEQVDSEKGKKILHCNLSLSLVHEEIWE